jgi:hypothetical protein
MNVELITQVKEIIHVSCSTHCLVAISRTCLSVFVICQSTWFHFSTNLILSDSQSLPWHHQNKSLIAHFFNMESIQATQEDNGIRMMVEIYMFIYAHKVREAVEDLTRKHCYECNHVTNNIEICRS